jgi:uncharacterized protein HemX
MSQQSTLTCEIPTLRFSLDGKSLDTAKSALAECRAEIAVLSEQLSALPEVERPAVVVRLSAARRQSSALQSDVKAGRIAWLLDRWRAATTAAAMANQIAHHAQYELKSLGIECR